MDEIISYKMCAIKVRNAKMTNIRKRQKSQDSRIKTLFAEIFNFKSYFCKLCMVTVNDIVGKLLKAKYK